MNTLKWALIIAVLLTLWALTAYFFVGALRKAEAKTQETIFVQKMLQVTNTIETLRLVEKTNEILILEARPILNSPSLDSAISNFYAYQQGRLPRLPTPGSHGSPLPHSNL